jgi:hypothetical protein
MSRAGRASVQLTVPPLGSLLYSGHVLHLRLRFQQDLAQVQYRRQETIMEARSCSGAPLLYMGLLNALSCFPVVGDDGPVLVRCMHFFVPPDFLSTCPPSPPPPPPLFRPRAFLLLRPSRPPHLPPLLRCSLLLAQQLIHDISHYRHILGAHPSLRAHRYPPIRHCTTFSVRPLTSRYVFSQSYIYVSCADCSCRQFTPSSRVSQFAADDSVC